MATDNSTTYQLEHIPCITPQQRRDFTQLLLLLGLIKDKEADKLANSSVMLNDLMPMKRVRRINGALRSFAEAAKASQSNKATAFPQMPYSAELLAGFKRHIAKETKSLRAREDEFAKRFNLDKRRMRSGCSYTNKEMTERVLAQADQLVEAMNTKDGSGRKREHLSLNEMAELFVKVWPTAVRRMQGQISAYSQFLYYDFDEQIYIPITLMSEPVQSIFVLAGMAMSAAGEATLKALLLTKSVYILPWVDLPSYQVAVGNGVYDVLEQRLIMPLSPAVFTTNKVATDYKTDEELKPLPFEEYGNATPEGLFYQLASNDEETAQALIRVATTMVCDVIKENRLTVIHGQGNDGKTFLFKLLASIVGSSSVSTIPLSGYGDDNNVAAMADKRVNIGYDNQAAVISSKSVVAENIKRMLGEQKPILTVCCKYRPPEQVLVGCRHIQCFNTIIAFVGEVAAMFRRVNVINLSTHRNNDDPNTYVNNLLSDRLIGNPLFAQHMLRFLLDNLTLKERYDAVANDLLQTMATDYDTLTQFLIELVDTTDIFSEHVKSIPMAYLKAAYYDWFEQEPRGESRPLGEKTLTKELRTKLDTCYASSAKRAYAYASDPAISPTLLLGPFAEGEHVKEITSRNVYTAWLDRKAVCRTLSAQDIGRQCLNYNAKRSKRDSRSNPDMSPIEFYSRELRIFETELTPSEQASYGKKLREAIKIVMDNQIFIDLTLEDVYAQPCTTSESDDQAVDVIVEASPEFIAETTQTTRNVTEQLHVSPQQLAEDVSHSTVSQQLTECIDTAVKLSRQANRMQRQPDEFLILKQQLQILLRRLRNVLTYDGEAVAISQLSAAASFIDELSITYEILSTRTGTVMEL